MIACDWSEAHVGTDRYTGTNAAAIHHYADIPALVQARLIERMDRHQYDGTVEINNDTPLAGMHYGAGKVCASVKRKWRAGFTVHALRYTEGEFTVLVPSACGNIVRSVWRKPSKPEAEPAVDYLNEPDGRGEVANEEPGGLSPTFASLSGDPIELSPLVGAAPVSYVYVWPAPIGFPARPALPVFPTPVPELPTWELVMLGVAAWLVIQIKERS